MAEYRYGLIGKTLKHSLSPEIHKHFYDNEYSLIELNEEELKDFLIKKDFIAVNVTIPYKQAVIPYLTKIDDFAKKIGSVNTIKKKKDGTLTGYNTDYFGFLYLIKSNGIKVKNKKAIVLGSGGSSKTVCTVLSDLGAKSVTVISRSGENNYQNISKHFDAEIIVNTTPVGMYPDNLNSPIDLTDFNDVQAVVDIIYNPLQTKLLLDAKKKNVKYANGLLMLVAQAKMAAEIFLDKKIPDSEIDRIYNIIKKQTENIVFVGMPGAGKSTIARELGIKLNREVFDTDKVVEEKTKKTIPMIFEEYGEEYFRKLETDAAKEIGKKTSSVIATGGGIIKKQENFDALKQNGFVVFLNRDINELSLKGRPLSTDRERLKEMYLERYPKYKEIADTEIVVQNKISDTVNKILNMFYGDLYEKN
ncbi:MAG: hypothetical protein E7365_04765 [Clostridiales bacterium]|nr:hypothetical protein [Clostridiales bacterium]